MKRLVFLAAVSVTGVSFLILAPLLLLVNVRYNYLSLQTKQIGDAKCEHHWYIYNTIQTVHNVWKPSCQKIIKGNSGEILNARRYDARYPYTKTINYIEETKDCAQFLHRRGYFLNNTEEEKEFPLAFSILMYKDVEQTERLLRAIYRRHNFYCVHVDADAAADVQAEVRAVVSCLPNVFLASRSIDVEWGGFLVLEPDLVCMQDLLKHPGWRYFINLTGQEFPLKTNLEIVRILKILNGTNSVDANEQKKWMRRWRMVWPPPHSITPYKGNVHAVVSRDFVDFAINDYRAQNFTEWLKGTKHASETFFSSLENNHHLDIPGASRGRVTTDYELKPFIARFKNWGYLWGQGDKTFDWPCAGKRVRQICILSVGDLPLLTSRRELFANKFHIDYYPTTLNCLEEWHRHRTKAEYAGRFSLNYAFYKNMPQVKNITGVI